MNHRRTLVTFVALQWIFLILEEIAKTIELQHLSGVLRECSTYIAGLPLTPLQRPLILLGGALLIANFVASVAMCFLKAWARTLYLSSFLLAGVVVILIFEPELNTPSGEWFGDCGTICTGITIGLLYWSPLAERFKGKVPNNGKV
ncbi:MAG: hypothetical protein NTY53_15500, partial [Kiritimatiellaeota bacterium]|nr:hypothetical protein [Kiritimatiellota bacterium]